MNPERIFIDEGVWPDARDQLVLADDFAGAFDQRGQDIERPATEANRLFTLQQQLLRRKKPKRAE
jgi:hypothetical protein